MQKFMDSFGIEADIGAVDINYDGEIDVDEFITAVLAPWLWKTDYRADEIFKIIDANNNGKIEPDEFLRLTSGEAGDLFAKIDRDHSGGISKGEFKTWVHHGEESEELK